MTLEEKYESLLSTMLTMREQLAKADAEVEALTAQLDEALKAFGSADRSRVALTTTLSATQKELEQRDEKVERAEKQFENSCIAFDKLQAEKNVLRVALEDILESAAASLVLKYDDGDVSIGERIRKVLA